MSFPFFANRLKSIVFCCGFLLFALILALVLKTIQHVPAGFWIDWLGYAFAYMFLSVLLWYAVKYANRGLNPLQTALNHFMFVILFVSISNLLVFWIYDIVNLRTNFVDYVWLRIFISVLVYIIVYQIIIRPNYAVEIDAAEDETMPFEQTNNDDNLAPEEEIDHVAVKDSQKIHVIPVQDILYLQAEGDYVMIFSEDNNYLKEQTMKSFEEQLPKHLFVRVHRSFIVNIEAIKGVETNEKQQHFLILKRGYRIKASANGYKLLKNRLKI